eukprot:5976556-Prymnesium_polylepis.1
MAPAERQLRGRSESRLCACRWRRGCRRLRRQLPFEQDRRAAHHAIPSGARRLSAAARRIDTVGFKCHCALRPESRLEPLHSCRDRGRHRRGRLH